MKSNLKKETLEKIEKEKIKPRPREFYQIIKAISWVFLTFLSLAAIYLFNLSFYLPRRSFGSGSLVRPGVIYSVPWGLVLLASVLIGLMIFVYNRYEGGYKKNIFWTIAIIGAVIILAGAVISKSRFNERLERHPGLKRMYGNFEESFIPKQGRQMRRNQLPLNLRYDSKVKYFD